MPAEGAGVVPADAAGVGPADGAGGADGVGGAGVRGRSVCSLPAAVVGVVCAVVPFVPVMLIAPVVPGP